MPRLILIGIDGMDPDVFTDLESKLPNLASLRRQGTFQRCNSTFPADSVPAWATIFTGVHPAKHGWLDNVDYEDVRKGSMSIDVKKLEGSTFWDAAGKQGRRVCVINPLLAYPTWPVNGLMVSGPVFITGDVQSYPENALEGLSLPQLGGMTDFPDQSQLDDFIQKTMQSTQELADFGYRLYQKEDWDLFFISFFTMDRLQHFLWRFYDPGDPTYPGLTSINQAIPDLYCLFDQIVGRFLALAGPDVSVIILSDHGHGRRPVNQINVNELLRRKGWLVTPKENNLISYKKWTEQLKNFTLRSLSHLGLEDWSYVIARWIPKKTRKALKKSSFVMDKTSSSAWASEMGGGTPVGGIEINQGRYLKGTPEYTLLTEQILTSLKQVNVDEKIPVVKWVTSSQNSLNNDKGYYPDLFFELDENYTTGRSLFTEILTTNPRHTRVSGGHKPQGIFFARGVPAFLFPEQISLLDIYPLILKVLGVDATL